jgi:hypothetical protein
MGSFLQRKEEKEQYNEMEAQARREKLKVKEEYDRTLRIHIKRLEARRKLEARQNILQQQTCQQRSLESKKNNEIKQPNKQLVNKQTVHEANNNEGPLAEFWEQRAQARRVYRAAQALGSMKISSKEANPYR